MVDGKLSKESVSHSIEGPIKCDKLPNFKAFLASSVHFLKEKMREQPSTDCSPASAELSSTCPNHQIGAEKVQKAAPECPALDIKMMDGRPALFVTAESK